MFDNEKQMVYFALMGWSKYIETGNFAGMDKKTILELARSDHDMKRVAERLPTLSREQQEIIYKIQDLVTKVLNTGKID